jgi:hypothetical protein
MYPAPYYCQPLRPGYCHGWHVCRFCRSKNRSSPHDVELAFSHPGHLLLWACCLFPAWLALPMLGVLLFGANTPWNRVRLTLGFGTRAANRIEKAAEKRLFLCHVSALAAGNPPDRCCFEPLFCFCFFQVLIERHQHVLSVIHFRGKCLRFGDHVDR